VSYRGDLLMIYFAAILPLGAGELALTLQETVNSDQYSQARSLILASRKVLKADGTL
jgi:hypothetical protein